MFCLRLAVPVIVLLGLSPQAHAQALRDDLYITNKAVNAVAVSGDILYIGGEFTHVGARLTGPLSPIDAVTGQVQQSIPAVRKGASFGTVLVVASDGADGWYVGGDFTEIDGVPRSNLAHLASDMTVTAWDPEATGKVHVILGSGSTVYVGGEFGNVGGQARIGVAALDATTGDATTWNPGLTDGYAYSLALSGSTIYIGGQFNTIGGQTRRGIAAVDVGTGDVLPWNPLPSMSARINALAVSGSTVYAGGFFSSIGFQFRSNIAALDATTGAATTWTPGRAVTCAHSRSTDPPCTSVANS
jgi:hypothetical protein